MGLNGYWAGRRVLVTGHTGFKGAWLALWLEQLGATVIGLALPPEDPRSAFGALGPWPELTSMMVDLRDAGAVQDAVRTADPQVILHLGAQALVRRAYRDPTATWAVNVIGTANLLEAARCLPDLEAVVVVTSDKVYANAGDGRAFVETDRLGGGDPYSSSKAAAELVAESWRQSYFSATRTGLATARAGNVIGGGDLGDNRLLPDVWRALLDGKPVRLRYPAAIRPWQFVLEPLHGYLRLAEELGSRRGWVPSTVNFGPDPGGCMAVATVVEKTLALWGGGHWELEPGDHPHEAAVLSLDATLALTALGWQPRLDVTTALEWTVAWWRAEAQGDDLRRLALDQVSAYEKLLGR